MIVVAVKCLTAAGPPTDLAVLPCLRQDLTGMALHEPIDHWHGDHRT